MYFCTKSKIDWNYQIASDVDSQFSSQYIFALSADENVGAMLLCVHPIVDTFQFCLIESKVHRIKLLYHFFCDVANRKFMLCYGSWIMDIDIDANIESFEWRKIVNIENKFSYLFIVVHCDERISCSRSTQFTQKMEIDKMTCTNCKWSNLSVMRFSIKSKLGIGHWIRCFRKLIWIAGTLSQLSRVYAIVVTLSYIQHYTMPWLAAKSYLFTPHYYLKRLNYVCLNSESNADGCEPFISYHNIHIDIIYIYRTISRYRINYAPLPLCLR